MAARKQIEGEVVNEEMIQDPWKEMRPFMIPRNTKSDPAFVTASVNGRVFKIQTGKMVDVPLPLWEVLENSRIQTEKNLEFEMDLENEFEEKTERLTRI